MVTVSVGVAKAEPTERGEDYLEPVSPERSSLPADEPYSDAEPEEEGEEEEEEGQGWRRNPGSRLRSWNR